MHDPPAQRTVLVPAPAALRPGEPRSIGPFRVRSRLGSGGMGDVYLGTTRRGQQVAIKLIRGAQLDDDEFRARFRREVRAAAKVRSRFIANLIDADPDAELPWLATEYVQGPTLAQALAAQGPLPESDVLRLVVGVAEALREMHRVGLVHRDVKPANVILGPDGPRLIDLGVVATVDATRLTLTGQPVGTPVYMAPEQASGSRATSAVDVWALGALAYYAATGNRLFDGDHPAVVLYRVAAEEPTYDDCPAYLRPFLDACLVRDPDGRPSLDAILRSLGVPDPAGAGPPSLAPGVARGARRRGRRRPLVVLGSVAAATAVLGAAAFGAWTGLAGGDQEHDPAGQTQTTAPPALQESGEPAQPSAGPVPDDAGTAGDGSEASPWAQGTERRLADGSCWLVSVDQVQGRLATLTLSCDQVGTSTYGNPTPSAWLRIYAIGQDGTVERSEPADAGAQDTFWALGNLADRAPVTTTVTLPDVGPLAAVAVQNTDSVGWYWAATP
ncbi:serine/threonine-protein kinase [Promicromonospora umidemergens]|uniref:serine/threonine-protein kinase n=1 Tax=Promicromonospora umidemergens TaxID=629679 RepID=UPI0020A35E8E|nr:serine/threonine-protein kinase [Promicromonospora umidemergens]